MGPHLMLASVYAAAGRYLMLASRKYEGRDASTEKTVVVAASVPLVDWWFKANPRKDCPSSWQGGSGCFLTIQSA